MASTQPTHSRPTHNTSPIRWETLLCSLLIAIALICLYLRLHATHENSFADIDIFLDAAESHQKNGIIYKRTPDLPAGYAPTAPTYKFPPFYLWTLKAFAGENRQESIEAIALSSLFFYCTTILICLILIHRTLPANSITPFRLSVLIAFFCLFDGFIASYGFLAPEIPINLLVCLAALLAQQRPFLAGNCIALASALKIYPAYMTFYFAAQWKWRALFGIAAITIISLAISYLYAGQNEFIFYFRKILPILASEPMVESAANLNMRRFFQSLGASRETAIALYYPLLLALTITTCKLLYQQRNDPWSPNRYCLVICLMLISMKNYWPQYLILLSLPVALMIIQSSTRLQKTACGFILLVLCTREEWAMAVAARTLQDNPGLITEQARISEMNILSAYFTIDVKAGILFTLYSLSPLAPVALWRYHFCRCR